MINNRRQAILIFDPTRSLPSPYQDSRLSHLTGAPACEACCASVSAGRCLTRYGLPDLVGLVVLLAQVKAADVVLGPTPAMAASSLCVLWGSHRDLDPSTTIVRKVPLDVSNIKTSARQAQGKV